MFRIKICGVTNSDDARAAVDKNPNFVGVIRQYPEKMGSIAVDTAVKISRIHAAFNQPATMSCALADRLDEFEREVVQPLALDELGSRATRIDHLGSYSYRQQNSRTAGRWSQHAQGQAIDISGFRLSDGTTVRGYEGEISLPPELKDVVQGVFGLDTHPIARRRDC